MASKISSHTLQHSACLTIALLHLFCFNYFFTCGTSAHWWRCSCHFRHWGEVLKDILTSEQEESGTKLFALQLVDDLLNGSPWSITYDYIKELKALS